METQASDKKQKMTKMTLVVFFKWVLLWLPLIVAVPGIIGSQQYQLVLRDDTISPVMGVPRSLFCFSLVGALGYVVMAFTFCREQLFTMFHSRIPKAAGLPMFSFIFAPISIWAVGQALNGFLDFSVPQQHQAKVQGLHYVKVTPYAKAGDWRDPDGYVLFRGGRSFLKQHPEGSTVTVLTKQGLLGYEYLIGIWQPPSGN